MTKPSKLQRELQQGRPFETLQLEVYLNLRRTHDRLSACVNDLVKTEGISQPQYNALRILRGTGPAGLASLEVASRMVTRVPDITRLLERLAARGYLTRERMDEDRRVVLNRLTRSGRSVLARLDEPIREVHKEVLGHMSERDLKQLNRLLEQARANDPDAD